MGFELFKFAGRSACVVFIDVTGELRRPATMSAAEYGLDPMAGPAGCPKPAPKLLLIGIGIRCSQSQGTCKDPAAA